MAYDLPTGAAYAVLYSTLTFFTILALGAGGFLSFLPDSLTAFCLLNRKSNDENGASSGKADYFLSARNSAGVWEVALSFFASGMGAWVLYGTTEMGATPALSWLGVIGYSSASSFPALLVFWLGPKVREMDTKAFSTTDFGRQRYGRVMQVSVAAVSVFYMFIFIVAELTSISSIFEVMTNNFDKTYSISITISLGVITIFYTTIAGLPASIVTDKFQGVIMGLLVVILTIAVPTQEENNISREEFALASNWTTDGLLAMLTLIIAIACAEMMNQATWQRVWAAKDVPTMRKGYFLGFVLVFFLMMFFGVMGMIAYANDPEAYDNFEKFAFLGFFDLLEPLGDGWHILVLVLVTALAASSIDSLENGLTSIFASDIVKIGWNPLWISRGLMVAINIPAIIMASKKYDVISLFLVADLVCATAVFPIFLGLQTLDHGILKAPTELGAFLAIISGIVTVLINGVINDADGHIFEYFWLRNGAICSLCGSQTLVTFIVTPSVTVVTTYAFSYLDIMVRGERARQPLIPVPFDEDDQETRKGIDEERSEEGEEVEASNYEGTSPAETGMEP
jgi:SSS family solute:Na+ symporter